MSEDTKKNSGGNTSQLNESGKGIDGGEGGEQVDFFLV